MKLIPARDGYRSRSVSRTQMLGISADSPNMASMHAAYIQGSVPTSVEESNDIITNDYPDEHSNNADSPDKQGDAQALNPVFQTLNSAAMPTLSTRIGVLTFPSPTNRTLKSP